MGLDVGVVRIINWDRKTEPTKEQYKSVPEEDFSESRTSDRIAFMSSPYRGYEGPFIDLVEYKNHPDCWNCECVYQIKDFDQAIWVANNQLEGNEHVKKPLLKKIKFLKDNPDVYLTFY